MDHFGWIGSFFAMDLTATSDQTRELLGWTPRGPTLVEDIRAGAYRETVDSQPGVPTPARRVAQ